MSSFFVLGVFGCLDAVFPVLVSFLCRSEKKKAASLSVSVILPKIPFMYFISPQFLGLCPFSCFFEGTRRGEFVWRDFWMGIFLWLLVKMRFGEIRVRVFVMLLILKSSKLFWMKG